MRGGNYKTEDCFVLEIMYNKKQTIAMLLAGGQGSRLYALTNKVAKPAVSFGAKYRIIDFTLSNCINSNIDTVGVLTQYQPLLLNDYIGNGQPWDLDRAFGGVHILPPYQAKDKTDWYKGTANAIYQNIGFIENYDAEYVVILSGDHIYKMDYSSMVDFHIQRQADCTIAVIEVPLKEANRFGIMNTDSTGRIVDFEEKPKQPKSNLASMGIYVFSTKVLVQYLREDDCDKTSSNDFGKNIIPNMLKAQCNMVAFPFKGYWKDVGTLDSLWEANMDLIGENPIFDIYDSQWKIHSRNYGDYPQFIGDNAHIENSLITGGVEVEGTIINSLISSSVKIAKGAIIKDSIIFSNCEIGENSVIEYSIIDEHVTVKENCKVGSPKEVSKGITVIGRNVTLMESSTVKGGDIIEKDIIKGGC